MQVTAAIENIYVGYVSGPATITCATPDELEKVKDLQKSGALRIWSIKPINANQVKCLIQFRLTPDLDDSNANQAATEAVSEVADTQAHVEFTGNVNYMIAVDISEGKWDQNYLRMQVEDKFNADHVNYSVGEDGRVYITLTSAEYESPAKALQAVERKILLEPSKRSGYAIAPEVAGLAATRREQLQKALKDASKSEYEQMVEDYGQGKKYTPGRTGQGEEAVSDPTYGKDFMHPNMRKRVNEHQRDMVSYLRNLNKSVEGLSQINNTILQADNKDAAKLRSGLVGNIKEMLSNMRNAIFARGLMDEKEEAIKNAYFDHLMGFGAYRTKKTYDEETGEVNGSMPTYLEQLKNELSTLQASLAARKKEYEKSLASEKADQESAKDNKDIAIINTSDIQKAHIDALEAEIASLTNELNTTVAAVRAAQKAKDNYDHSDKKENDRTKYKDALEKAKGLIKDVDISSLIPTKYRRTSIGKDIDTAVEHAHDKDKANEEALNAYKHTVKDPSGAETTTPYSVLKQSVDAAKKNYDAVEKAYDAFRTQVMNDAVNSKRPEFNKVPAKKFNDFITKIKEDALAGVKDKPCTVPGFENKTWDEAHVEVTDKYKDLSSQLKDADENLKKQQDERDEKSRREDVSYRSTEDSKAAYLDINKRLEEAKQEQEAAENGYKWFMDLQNKPEGEQFSKEEYEAKVKELKDKLTTAQQRVELLENEANKASRAVDYINQETDELTGFTPDTNLTIGDLNQDFVKELLQQVYNAPQVHEQGKMSTVPETLRTWLSQKLEEVADSNPALSVENKALLKEVVDNTMIKNYVERNVSEQSKGLDKHLHDETTQGDDSHAKGMETAKEQAVALKKSLIPPDALEALLDATYNGLSDTLVQAKNMLARYTQMIVQASSSDDKITDKDFKEKYNTSLSQATLRDKGQVWLRNLTTIEKVLDTAKQSETEVSNENLRNLILNPSVGLEALTGKHPGAQKVENVEITDEIAERYYAPMWAKLQELMQNADVRRYEEAFENNWYPAYTDAIAHLRNFTGNARVVRERILDYMEDKAEDRLNELRSGEKMERGSHHKEKPQEEELTQTYEQGRGSEEDPAASPTDQEQSVGKSTVFNEGKTPIEQ